MEINKTLIFCLVMLCIIPLVNSITCSYNENPLIENKISWMCYNVSSNYCISQVEFNNETIQTNPIPKTIQGIGMIDKFEVNNKIVNIHFRKDLLRDKRKVIFKVICDNESFAVNVTPRFSEYPQLIDRGSWLQDNIGYIIGWIVIIIIALIFFRWVWEQRK